MINFFFEKCWNVTTATIVYSENGTHPWQGRFGGCFFVVVFYGWVFEGDMQKEEKSMPHEEMKLDVQLG